MEEQIAKLTTRWKAFKESIFNMEQRVDRLENTTSTGMTSIVKRNFEALGEGLKISRKGNEDSVIRDRKMEATIQQMSSEIQQLKQELAIIKSRTYGTGSTK